MKFIYPILILTFLVTASQAQILRGYGFKIGATLASEDWDYTRLSTDFTPDCRWGFNLGVFGAFLNIPYFSLITELNYVQKGMTKELPVTTITHPDGTGEYVTWDSRIDYLNLSALGKLRSSFGSFTPYILIGPKIDFELGVDNSLGTTNEVEDEFKNIMYGVKMGGGIEIELPNFSLLAEVLYDYNFNSLFKNENLTVTESSVDFRLGIMF